MLAEDPGPAADPPGSSLDASILHAHARADLGDLARLYAEAGRRAEAAGQTDAACFFWTQAWIFALDHGDPTLARDLEDRLSAAGRMPPPAG